MSKPTYKNYIKIGIIFGVVAYIIMFVYTFFVQDISTIVLKNGIVEEVSIADGIITRTEEVVTLNVEDNLRPLVSSGERVSKGHEAPLPVMYRKLLVNTPKSFRFCQPAQMIFFGLP